jgi:hypothetical protein
LTQVGIFGLKIYRLATPLQKGRRPETRFFNFFHIVPDNYASASKSSPFISPNGFFYGVIGC